MRRKNKQFDSEERMAEHVVAWLESDGWDVYQEVRLHDAGACPDIIAVKDRIVWVIECKLSLGLSVIEQAHKWSHVAHFRSVAVPRTRDQEFAKLVAKRFGIGVIVVSHYVTTVHVEEAVQPELLRNAASHRVLDKLKPEHKTHAKAGTSGGGRYTPFRATCEAVMAAVAKEPGITLKELISKVSTHYASSATARATLPKRIEKGLVPGVRLEREGGLIKLYPD